MNYDLTIPVWGIILFIVPFIVAGLWVIVKMFFWQKSANERMNAFDVKMEHSDLKHDKLEKEFNENIVKVRTDFEKELEGVNNNIKIMLEKQIETQTLVKLLVEKRIG